jgi:hypothetical protein
VTATTELPCHVPGRPDIGISRAAYMPYGKSQYKGVFVYWDGRFDARVCDWIDRLHAAVRGDLFAVHLAGGRLQLSWLGTDHYPAGSRVRGEDAVWVVVTSFVLGKGRQQ